MKFTINLLKLNQSPEIWLRRAGYVFLPERAGGTASFARRLTRDFYPRFHIYLANSKTVTGQEMIIFNLHLDQKRPGYSGYNRHNAEYDGELVEQEIARLKSLISLSL